MRTTERFVWVIVAVGLIMGLLFLGAKYNERTQDIIDLGWEKREQEKTHIHNLEGLRDKLDVRFAKDRTTYQALLNERDALAAQVKNLTAEKAPQKEAEKRGDVTSAAGFDFFDVTFQEDGEIIGRVTNGSPKDYRIAMFELSVFDAEGGLVKIHRISLQNIAAGQTKSFSGGSKAELPPGGRYEIDFTFGG